MHNLRKAALAAFILLCGFITLSAQSVGDVEYGLASYYSDDFQGRKTSYGEVYDKNQLTAAHKLFPYNSRIRVTRIDNGRSVVVRVTDQGPYIRGRVVDLSRRAAEALDLVKDATAEVKVELIELPGSTAARSARPATATPATVAEPAAAPSDRALPPPRDRLREVQVSTSIAENRAQQPSTATASADNYETLTAKGATPANNSRAAGNTSAAARAPLVTKDFRSFGLYKIEIRKPASTGYGVQVASFSDYEGAMRKVAELQAKWFDNILVSIEPDGQRKPVYKVVLGPFDNEASAQRYERDLQRKYKINGFTINLQNIKY